MAKEQTAPTDLKTEVNAGGYREQSNSSREETSRGTSTRLGKSTLPRDGCWRLSVDHSRLKLGGRVEDGCGAFPAAERSQKSLDLAVRKIQAPRYPSLLLGVHIQNATHCCALGMMTGDRAKPPACTRQRGLSTGNLDNYKKTFSSFTFSGPIMFSQ